MKDACYIGEVNGVIVVDKPPGWTSHDVVNKIRRFANTKKVGHLGTLDPMATGVLPLVIERATRLAQFYTRNDKVYEAVIGFGFSTDTYDREGVATSPAVAVNLSPEILEQALDSFRGVIQQVPPAVSAKKINGVPAYRLARKQQVVELPAVQITIHSLDLLGSTTTEATVRIHCSSGTYVRSIAHDLGVQLGCGAHLTALRRTRTGDFTLERSRTLEELKALAEAGRFEEAMIPASDLLPDFPSEFVDDLTVGQIRQGRDFRVSPFRVRTEVQFVKAVSAGGDLIAIGEAKLKNVYHPVLVL